MVIKFGILIAPIILIDGWEKLYEQLFNIMNDKLSKKAKNEVFFELIFMTYSYVHRMINKEAFPNAIELYNQDKMTGRGMGKYMYKKEEREYAEKFLVDKLKKNFKKNKIWYIV